MKKNEYLIMLYQDNETEQQPLKELHEAVLECTVEAVSQTDDEFEIDGAIGLQELYKVIETAGKSSKAQCVSPFRAAELIAEKLGAKYQRPMERMRAQFGQPAAAKPKTRLEDFF